VAATRAWAELAFLEQVADATYWMEFAAPEIAARAIPGQFVMIGVGLRGATPPFLPRPMSVGSTLGGRLGLLVRVFGEGSRRLTQMRVGERALLLGPLGTRFEPGSGRRILCVAGGVGLAPFLYLPQWARAHRPEAEIRLLYGERRGAAIFRPARIREIAGLEPEIWSEDGSEGRRGKVTDQMELATADVVLACGPTAMLQAVQSQAQHAGVPAQLSVEERMACGVGTCVGCVIAVDDGAGGRRYERVCVEGPVFPAERVRWSI
jgi:dihydroorotate dehydrogenase electron transfer subunit